MHALTGFPGTWIDAACCIDDSLRSDRVYFRGPGQEAGSTGLVNIWLARQITEDAHRFLR